MKSHALRLTLPIVIAAFFLWRFLAGLDLSAVGHAIAGVRPIPLAIGLVLGVVVVVLRAWRWQRLLRGLGHVPLASAYHATAIGFGASVVLPLKAGEVIRPVMVARERSLPVSGLLASVLVERLLDLVAILALFLFAIFQPTGLTAAEGTRAGMTHAASLAFVGLVALVAGLVLLAVFREKFLAATIGRARFLPEGLRHKLEEFARHCLEGFVALRDPVNAIVILAQTFGLWLLIDVQVFQNLIAFSLDVPFRSTYVVVALSAAGLAAGTPGGVGSFHKAVQFAAELYGASPDRAAAFAVVHHLACFVPLLVLGVISAFARGLSWGSLRGIAATPDEEPPADRSPKP